MGRQGARRRSGSGKAHVNRPGVELRVVKETEGRQGKKKKKRGPTARQIGATLPQCTKC